MSQPVIKLANQDLLEKRVDKIPSLADAIAEKYGAPV